MAFIGELSLDGTLRRINGVLPMVLCAKKSGIEKIFIPHAYEKEYNDNLVNNYTSIIEVGGITFKNFLPIFFN